MTIASTEVGLGTRRRGRKAPQRLALPSGQPAALLSISAKRRRFLSATKAFLGLLGLNRNQVVARSLHDVFGPTSSDQIAERAAACLARHEPVRLKDVECAEPGVLPLDVLLRPIPCSEEPLVEVRLAETDSTTRSTERLLASLFQDRSQFGASAIYVNDLASGLTRCTRNGFTRTFGLNNSFSFGELVGRSHPEDTDGMGWHRAYRAERRALADGEVISTNGRGRTLSGSWRVVSIRARVLERNADGSPAKMLGVIYDQTRFNAVYHALIRTNDSLIKAEEAERERIGRELHDSLSQLLVGAQLSLGSLAASLSSPGQSRKVLEVERAIQASLSEVRTFSFLLHPPDLKEHGLAGAIDSLCHGFARRTGLQVTFVGGEPIVGLGKELELGLFRVAQEALMNVHRHARASSVIVRLRRAGERVELEVVDDGVGLTARPRSDPTFNGVGVAGMKARMNNAGGDVVLENRRPGLRVLAHAPIETERLSA